MLEKRSLTVFRNNFLSEKKFGFKLLKIFSYFFMYNLLIYYIFCFFYFLYVLKEWFSWILKYTFLRQDLLIIPFLSTLDTYGAWLALSIFFFSRAGLFEILEISHQNYMNLHINVELLFQISIKFPGVKIFVISIFYFSWFIFNITSF